MTLVRRAISTGMRKILVVPPCRYRHLSITRQLQDSKYRRSDFEGQGFEGSITTGQPTSGPLAGAPDPEAIKFTPSKLKAHLDKFVVGQDKAKKVASVAIANHYQRIREVNKLYKEHRDRLEEEAKKEQEIYLKEKSFLEDHQFPGIPEPKILTPRIPNIGASPPVDKSSLVIEKSNLLLLGPSGVGKTHIVQTLAKVLEVPFTTIDCSSLTQAGYQGSDVESCVERLLIRSAWDIQKCETGIVFFDEIDKIAKPPRPMSGRDVAGEGVQQSLLKIIEGTTVMVRAKVDRSTNKAGGPKRLDAPPDVEQFSVDTSNILFIFAGAFVGLEKIVSARVHKSPGFGFGSTLLQDARKTSEPSNVLADVTPADLQRFGMIPELIGRIPVVTALQPLELKQLVSILSEPKHSLVEQYKALFMTYGIEILFTRYALESIAARALSPDGKAPKKEDGKKRGKEENGGGVGARGLRGIMESVLSEAMFWAPGSSIKYILIDQEFVDNYDADEVQDADVEDNKRMPRVWSRGQAIVFYLACEEEDRRWRDINLQPSLDDEWLGSEYA
ncbi:ATP-dependent CLP protease ATP-binding subunit ClpX [Phlyctema vagabunda]|uniref:ATP-dependent CLP protease ATP-binding subunit ClpX n=1 Tax=Phlyctema vagabunda TaxID=108571 RepID=A0ABR4PD79_9HELO